MKKIIWLISLIIYLFSANALVHASTMGFFDNNPNPTTITHCHSTQTSNWEQSNKDISCCELTFSNQYSHAQPKIKNLIQKQIFYTISTINIQTTQHHINNNIQLQFPPGQNTDNKYNKFSDLIGSIVNII